MIFYSGLNVKRKGFKPATEEQLEQIEAGDIAPEELEIRVIKNML